MYFSAIDSIAGDVLPLSCLKKNLIGIFYGSKDSGWCFPAIESIAGVHIVEFYRSRDVFSRYRIYHFEDFTWSIAGGHIKNRPQTLQCLADFLLNVFGRFSRLAVLSPTPIPTHAVHYTNTSGYWPRVRAPVFLDSLPCQTGRCAPPLPAHRSFAASYLSN